MEIVQSGFYADRPYKSGVYHFSLNCFSISYKFQVRIYCSALALGCPPIPEIGMAGSLYFIFNFTSSEKKKITISIGDIVSFWELNEEGVASLHQGIFVEYLSLGIINL